MQRTQDENATRVEKQQRVEHDTEELVSKIGFVSVV